LKIAGDRPGVAKKKVQETGLVVAKIVLPTEKEGGPGGQMRKPNLTESRGRGCPGDKSEKRGESFGCPQEFLEGKWVKAPKKSLKKRMRKEVQTKKGQSAER